MSILRAQNPSVYITIITALLSTIAAGNGAGAAWAATPASAKDPSTEPLVSAGQSGNPATAADLVRDTFAVQRHGCGATSGVECADMALFAAGLLGIGEYTAALTACDAVTRRGNLPDDALKVCAEAAARLGDGAQASEWLVRYVDLAGAGADRVRAATEAADLLIQNARYASARRFLQTALDASGDSMDLRKRVFSNCLDAGDAACATAMADKIARADETGEGALFTIREFFSHDLFQAALPSAELLQSRGLASLEHFGVILQVYARAGTRDRACAAAESCLKKCPGADVATIASTMSRSLMRREAAEFAEKNVAGYRDQATARFEVARLWLAAGEVDKAFVQLADWVREPAATGISWQERLLTAGKFLLGERRHDRLLDLLAQNSSRMGKTIDAFTDEVAWLNVSAMIGRKDWAGAEKAAMRAVEGAFERERIGYRLAWALFDARRNAAAAAVLTAARTSGGAADDLIRARMHLLAAKLINGGAMQGDIQQEIRDAFEFANGDAQTVRNIARFVAALKLPAEFEILAAVNMAAANPDDSAELRKLADVYVKNGLEDEAVDAFLLYLRRSGATEKGLVEAVDALLAAKFYGGAFQLAESFGLPVEFPPAVARRLSDACLQIGERSCVRRYLEIFLAGPVTEDYDYLRLAEGLIGSGYYTLAGKVLDVAARVVPTDRRWRVKLLRGRVALFSGDSARAQKQYRGVMKLNPGNPAVAVAISSDYSKIGDINGALTWIRSGMDAAEAKSRLDIFPLWVDTMRRLGRASEIDIAVLDGSQNPYMKGAANALNSLLAAGRVDLARQLLARMDHDGSVGADLKRIEVAALQNDRDAAVAVASGVCESAERYTEGACAEVCAALSDAGWTNEAWDILKRSAVSTNFQIPPREAAALVTEALKRGDSQTALQAAEKLSPSLYQKAARLEDIWPMFPAIVGHQAWRGLLVRLAANPDFLGDGRILMELGLAEYLSGNTDRGFELVSRYADAGAPMLSAAFRILVVAGLVDQASAVIDAAPDQVISNFGPAEIGMVTSSFASRGMTDRAGAFADRYLKSADGSIAARMNLALAALPSGDTRETLASLRTMDGPSMGPRDRLQYGAVLWTTGDRDAAMKQFRTVLALDTDVDELRAYRKFVLSFLDSENAMLELADLLANPPNAGYTDPEDDRLRAMAEISISGDQHLEAARAMFFRYLRNSRTIYGDGRDGGGRDIPAYVRLEARRGTVGGLASDAIGRRGAAFAQVALYAACLADDAGSEDIIKAALDRLVPASAAPGQSKFIEVADPVDLLAVSDILFDCGRWADASAMAMRFLESNDIDVAEMTRAAGLAVRGALAAGRKNPLTPEVIDRITDDGLIRFSLQTAVARAAGDASGERDAASNGMTLMHEESTLFLDLIAAAVRSGPDASVSDIRAQSMKGLAFPGRHYGAVLQTLFNMMQYGPAEDFIKTTAAKSGWTIDRLADLFKVQIEAGDSRGAIQTARTLLTTDGGRVRSIATLVAYSSSALRRDVTNQLVSEFLAMPTDRPEDRLAPDVVDQFVSAAQFLFATGIDGPTAVRLVDRVWNQAIDRPGVCGQITSRLMMTGPRDKAFFDYVSTMFADGRCASPELRGRLDDMNAVTMSGPAACPTLKASYSDDGFILLMVRAVRTAVVSGRYRDAADWARFAFERLGSFSDRITVIQALVDYLGDQTAVPPFPRTILARFALNAIAPDTVDNGRLAMLIAQIIGMIQNGPVEDRIVAAMNDEVRIAPSSPHARNNLAYTLSTNDFGQKRAIPEIKLASILAGIDRGAYLETEAWAWFKYGKTARALETQAAAARFWNRADLSVGLAECWNHYGNILEAAGRTADAAEMYRRSAAAGDAWNWHSMLSMRKLTEMGYFNSTAEAR